MRLDKICLHLFLSMLMWFAPVLTNNAEVRKPMLTTERVTSPVEIDKQTANGFLKPHRRRKRDSNEECREGCNWEEMTETFSDEDAREFMINYKCGDMECPAGCYVTRYAFGHINDLWLACNPVCNGQNICPNGGTCIATETCQCLPGFTGSQCEDVNECSTNNGGCNHHCHNTAGSFYCSCNSGYLLQGGECIDVNECSTNNGGCNHHCHNTAGSFYCSCDSGYLLQGGECIDVNECSTNNGGCNHHCHNTAGSFYCSCNSGYLLQGGECIDTNECAINNGGCSQLCFNVHSSYYCGCKDGYSLASDSHSCTDIDECQIGTVCDHQCVNNEGSYQCTCDSGYFLDFDNTTCIDIDDCVGQICENGGSCTDLVNGFSCKCSQGYEGKFCEQDIDECLYGNGGCPDICININGSYLCKCENGINPDGSCSGNGETSFFSKHKIPRKLLPRGCAVLELISCDGSEKLVFSSTSHWFRHTTDSTMVFTYGIVFVEVSGLSLPVSVTGLKIKRKGTEYDLVFGFKPYDTSESILISNTSRNNDCLSLSTTPKDIAELLLSFTPTLFNQLNNVLPNWVRFSENGTRILSVTDVRTDARYGYDIANIMECRGAPVQDNHMYNVFVFGSEFTLSLYGNKIDVPKPLAGNKICFLVDICQDNVGTVFFLLPPESRNIFDSFNFFEQLNTKFNLRFRPIGIGLSIPKTIDVRKSVQRIQFWNGDNDFYYPVFDRANMWMSTDIEWGRGNDNSFFQLNAVGRAEMFLGFPSFSSFLTGAFIEEWNALLTVDSRATIRLRFKVFGENVVLDFKDILVGSVDVYLSIGGTSTRTQCGNGANPEGIYATFLVGANPFRNIPVLNIRIDINVKVKAFVSTDSTALLQNKETLFLDDVIGLRELFTRFGDLLSTFMQNLQNQVSDLIDKSLIDLELKVSNYTKELELILSIQKFNIFHVMPIISGMWDYFSTVLEKSVNNLLDLLEFETLTLIFDIRQMLKDKVNEIGSYINALILRKQDELFGIMNHYTGFGIKLSGDVSLASLLLGKVDIEIVYSLEALGQCSRFSKAYSILANEEALKILLSFTWEKSLGYFLKVRKGTSVSLALAVNLKKFVAHFQATVTVLGITDTIDVIVSNKMIIFQIERSIFDVFYARVAFEASLGNNWYDLTFGVNGDFLAKDDNGFAVSYADGLRLLAKRITDEAIQRLDKAQEYMTHAQNGLSAAQTVVTDAQRAVQKAHSAFDKAVGALESAKTALERAKEPFNQAMESLKRAQRNVDRLCRIRHCSSICIPGLIFRWCRGWWGIRYPCLKWTSCMFRIPNIFCIAANALCRILRGIAYLVLEAAKFVVRIALVTFDIAKAAVSVAQFVVDKSRIVLDLAVAVLEVVKFALDAAKFVLEIAKKALDVIKFVLRAALFVVDLIIKYGLKNLIDVKNCGFEIQISTTDKFIFDVSCEINAFRLGWRTFGFEFNFKNPIHSMWKIAKSSIEMLFDAVTNLFGRRKKRDLTFKAMSKIHHILHLYKRDTLNSNFTDDLFNGNASSEGDALYMKDKYEDRSAYFEFQCSEYIRIFSFLSDGINDLILMTNESVTALQDVDNFTETQGSNFTSSNFSENTPDDFGIDIEYAYQEFNITPEEIYVVMNNNTENIHNDPYMSQMVNESEEVMATLNKEKDNARQLSVMNYWIMGMDNATREYFNESECSGLQDCVLFSVSEFYDIFGDESLAENSECRRLTMVIEDLFLGLLSNNTWTIFESLQQAVDIQEKLSELNASNVWCSTAPNITSEFDNLTTVVGQTVRFTCLISGNPTPSVQWFVNDTVIKDGENNTDLTLENIDVDDEGIYRCEAENIVSRVVSGEFDIRVTECSPGEYFNGKSCVTCDDGYFQPLKNQLTCEKCGAGSTSSSDRKECVEDTDLAVIITVSVSVVAFLSFTILVGYQARRLLNNISKNKIKPRETMYIQSSDIVEKSVFPKQHKMDMQ